MSEQVNWEAVISFNVKNGDDAASVIRRVSDALHDAQAAGKKFNPEIDRVAKSLDNLTKSSDKGTASTRGWTSAWSPAISVQKQFQAEIDKTSTGNLPRLRYALYDVSTSLAVVGGGLLLVAGMAYKTAINYQRDFAGVIRTTGVTGEAASKLRQEFIGLSQEMPVAFSELTKIGTLAGQLNIAQNEVASFTETTAKFSATSGVGIEETATALGRLNALLPDADGNYNALASSVLKVGVNSLATESQIIATTSQLAGIGAQAGLSADQIIGFAGAFASVGIAPELARGTFVRMIGQIQRAVTAGGESLENFGVITGQTGRQFKQAFSSDASGTILSLLEGINSKGSGAAAALNSLGITSARDVPALLKLAQNSDILAESLGNAATGVADATEVNNQYGIMAETVSARLQVLVGNFNALLAAVGDSGTGIGFLVDGLSNVLKFFTDLISTPAGAWFTGVGIAMVGLLGIIALVIAGATRLVASMAAVITASDVMGASSVRAALGANSLSTALLGTGRASQVAATGIRAAGFAMKAATVVGIALIALEIAQAFGNWGSAAEGARDSVNNLASSFNELNMKNLTAAFGSDALGAGMGPSLQNYINQVKAAKDGTFDLAYQINRTFRVPFSSNIDDTVKAYDTELANLVNNGNAEGAKKVFDEIKARLVEQGYSASDVTAIFDDYAAALRVVVGVSGEATTAIGMTSDEFKQLIDDVYFGVNAANDMGNALSSLGESFANSGADAAVSGDEMQRAIALIFAQSGDSQTAANNMQGFFDALVSGGYASRAELSMLAQVIAGLGGSKVSNPFDISPLAKSFDEVGRKAGRAASSVRKVAKEVRTLVNYASDLSGVFGRAFDLRFGNQMGADKIAEGWQSVADATLEARQNLDDYRAKLAGLTADRAIQEYFLSVAKSYGDTLRAGTISAKIAEIDADIAKTKGDVANATTTASKTLTGNSKAAISNRKTITDLVRSYEEQVAVLAATGMSQAELSRQTALLQQDFMRQGTQLGYNQSELASYASAFDDVSIAISRVPRNITVGFDPRPAYQALNEFAAQTVARSAAAGTAAGNAFSDSYNNGAMAKYARGQALLARIESYRAVAANNKEQPYTRMMYANSASILSAQYNSGQYWSGGFTGRGGKYDYAGAVHKGEYVIPKEDVNQRTGLPNADALGRAQPQSRPAPGYSGGGFVTGGMGDGYMSLSPTDRQLLINIANNVGISIDGRELTTVVNGTNVNSGVRGIG